MTRLTIAVIAALALSACDHAKPYVAGDIGVAAAKSPAVIAALPSKPRP
jgi:hypothetical protein